MIAVQDCVITIDAMGSQMDIAKMIIEREADYILQVKDNQKGLREQIEDSFKILPVQATHTELDMGHGRIEVRRCDVISNLELVEQQPY